MKLQTPSSKILAATLAMSAKCMAGKNSISILDNVLLMQKDGKFVFVSSNQSAQLTIPAPFSVVEGEFTEPIALPIDKLSSFVSSLPDCIVTFAFANDESHSFTIEYCTEIGDKLKQGKASLTYVDGKDFPFLHTPEGETSHIQLPMTFFTEACDNAAPFAGSDQLRPVMECMLIDIADDFSRVTFVSTDGKGLYKNVYTNDPKTGGGDFNRGSIANQTIVHKSNLRTLSVFADQETVDIESNDDAVRFSSGDIEYICKRTEGRYPNYNAVIPTNAPSYICFNKKEMLAIVKRVSLLASSTSKLIELEKGPSFFINISARDVDFARYAEDQVIATNAEGAAMRIGFNSDILMKAINAIDADTIRMQLVDATRPVTLTADTPSPTVLTLCMPLIIQD